MKRCTAFSTYDILFVRRDSDKNNSLTMLEAIMKEALMSIMRQEQEALEARIAEEERACDVRTA